ncbi:MAG: membrane protein insertase YidC, partial [Verrucomicrobia bacterium]|nr:membrane protein insertase YidC [Verrucomicrobiota bacterium]
EAVTYAGPEQTVLLTNALARVVVSSHGGTIVHAELPAFRASLDKSSGPVELDFADSPALALHGLGAADVFADFDLAMAPGSDAVVARARNGQGVVLERTIRLVDSYHLEVLDTFRNDGSDSVTVPAHAVAVGPMRMNSGESQMQGMVFLGVDTLAADGKHDVEHWGKEANDILGIGGGIGCSRPSTANVPVRATRGLTEPVAWLAAKNKFFVQILVPDTPAKRGSITVERDAESKVVEIASVSGALEFEGTTLAPGTFETRRATYYVGPKQYGLLKELGNRQQDIMQFGWFGWFRWICASLLHALNFFHGIIPNYGVAIMLVTLVVRLAFWPITQKATASMKKMQKIQPLVMAIREKHKKDAQKMNQEVMLLYREHRVNPMSGCLPMLVQIPVFIALFTVLRSAVELRYAEFLWIRDLSEPENLLHGMIPLIGSLNILPLFMTATTLIQQKMTPMAGDPMQQKIMMYMPIMFLFFFYTMPSALVLYWTVSQLLAILQLKLQQRKDKDDPAPVVVPAGGAKRR